MRSLSIAATAASLACLFAAPAHALRANTYVASYGADSGNCSFSAPCRTFAFALSQVQAGGVVTAIDSAGNSPFTIDKSVTITAPPGVSPSIQTPSNSVAITINAGPNDVVVLSGLTLAGEYVALGAIALVSGQQLDIVNCSIRGFQYAVNVAPTFTTTAPRSVLISNTVIADNTDGVDLTASAPITAILENVTIYNNAFGVNVDAPNYSLEVLIENSFIDNNTNAGIVTSGNCSNNAIATVALRNVSLNQTPHPIWAVGSCSNIYLSDVEQALGPPLAYNPGVIVAGQNINVFSDGTNLTSAPPNSFGVWGRQ